MARIKIKDLPKDMKISRQDLRLISGGNVLKSDGVKIPVMGDVCLTPADVNEPIPVPYPSEDSTKETGQPVIQAYLYVPDLILND